MKKREIKKSRIRFNAADLLITALLLLCIFNVFSGFVFGDRTDREYRVTFELDAEEARQIGLAGITASKGDEVYLSGFEEALGKLEQDFSPDSGQLVAVVTMNVRESRILVYGDAVTLRIGKLYSKNAIIKSIEEVSG